MQIQGPKSVDLMVDLFGPELAELPSYGLTEGSVVGHSVIISQTGFTGEKGYEIYLRDASLYAEDMWNSVPKAGEPHKLKVIAPAHHRWVAAGILSWGQDMGAETLPFQVNLGYQVPRKKEADYIGKAALERAREEIEASHPPYAIRTCSSPPATSGSTYLLGHPPVRRRDRPIGGRGGRRRDRRLGAQRLPPGAGGADHERSALRGSRRLPCTSRRSYGPPASRPSGWLRSSPF